MNRRHVPIEELSLDHELEFHGKPDGIVPELYTPQQLCWLTAEAMERNHKTLFSCDAWQSRDWYEKAAEVGLPIDGIGKGRARSQREIQRRQAVLLRRLARRSDEVER